MEVLEAVACPGAAVIVYTPICPEYCPGSQHITLGSGGDTAPFSATNPAKYRSANMSTVDVLREVNRAGARRHVLYSDGFTSCTEDKLCPPLPSQLSYLTRKCPDCSQIALCAQAFPVKHALHNKLECPQYWAAFRWRVALVQTQTPRGINISKSAETLWWRIFSTCVAPWYRRCIGGRIKNGILDKISWAIISKLVRWACSKFLANLNKKPALLLY